MSICKACGADMLWVRLDSGKPMPLDPHPDDQGNVAVYIPERRSSKPLHAYVVSQAKPLRIGYRAYMPHHATCPNWRKKPPPAAPANQTAPTVLGGNDHE